MEKNCIFQQSLRQNVAFPAMVLAELGVLEMGNGEWGMTYIYNII